MEVEVDVEDELDVLLLGVFWMGRESRSTSMAYSASFGTSHNSKFNILKSRRCLG